MTAVTGDFQSQPGEAIAGRSLWADAWRRLLRNRAAVTGAIVLGVIALLAIFGPMLSPHPIERVFHNYVRMPPSLTAYPHPEAMGETLDDRLRRGMTVAEDWQYDDEEHLLTATVIGEEAIDVNRLIDRVARHESFTNITVLNESADGTEVELAVGVVRYHFFLGTDSNGRDLMSRVFYGGRISLMIGLAATLVSLLIGITYGATSGFLGGRADHIMMRVVDILYSLPFMFFVILLMVFFGRNIFLMFIALGAVEWLDMARIVRGQTLSVKRREFIEAAHACGVSNAKIIRRHVVPNVMGPVVVYMTLTVPKVILIESFLSFLGLGVQEPMTSWGVLIADGANNMEAALWMLFWPALFLATTLFCLNFIGDGLRDALDPKDR